MKTALISVRFPKEDAAIIEKIAKEERTDKTTAFKKIFALGTRQYNLENAIRQYGAGKISIGKAAEIAGISIWEIMEELKARNIANPMTRDDYREGLKNLQKLLK